MTAQYTAAYPRLAEHWDHERGCWTVHQIDGGLVVQVAPLLFTAAVLVSRPRALTYEDRWCYGDVDAAWAAAIAWAGPWPGSEPDGWHRHPTTGRRREHGHPDAEEVWA